MPWYKFYAKHGPGHAGYSEGFSFSERPLSRDQRQERWDKLFGNYEYPIGGVKLVRELPRQVLDEKIRGYRASIEFSLKMLHLLKADCPFDSNGGCVFCANTGSSSSS